MDRHGAVRGETDVVDHLAHAHLHDEKLLRLLCRALHRVRRERPERDRADEANLEALLARLIDGASRDTARRAVGDDDQVGVLGAVLLRALLVRLDRLVAGIALAHDPRGRSASDKAN